MGTPTTAPEATHQRRRAAKIANERTEAAAGIAITFANTVIIAGLIAPLFSTQLDQSAASIALAVLIAGLPYAGAHLILALLEPEE
jgi:hypothetical protein